MNIAVLLTCYNRKNKTFKSLDSLFKARLPEGYSLSVYLVDDGSTDGTSEMIRNLFPNVKVINGSGSLFWAGGMRLAYEKASKGDYSAYLLLNDDVELNQNFLETLKSTEDYCINKYQQRGIYSMATESNKGEISYGALKIIRNGIILRTKRLIPNGKPQKCELTNANILLVSSDVIREIGFFDDRFTHGIADYDYSYSVFKNGFPVLLASHVGGVCEDDHGNNWKSRKTNLKERIKYLYDSKGLAYREYIYYIKKNFPLYLPYSFGMLWLKTLFPILWDKYKTSK